MNSLFADTEEWGQVFVIDSDALIDIKLEISVAEQWDVGVDIVRAAENHKLLMPIQVHNEAVNVRYPDFPAPLASKVWSIIRGGARRGRPPLTAQPLRRQCWTLKAPKTTRLRV